MAFIPHPTLFLSHIRVNDIWFLLAVGAVWELFCRLVVLLVRMKPAWLIEKEVALAVLQVETNAKRKLGPSAFVETSKLERQVLVQQRELEKIYADRKRSGDNVEKQLLRYGNIQVSILIFVLYYGVPMFTIETGVDKNLDDLQDPGLFFKRALFPVTYVGMGQKISKWGIGDAAEASVGALMILWSAQATVGKLFDAIDAYYL